MLVNNLLIESLKLILIYIYIYIYIYVVLHILYFLI